MRVAAVIVVAGLTVAACESDVPKYEINAGAPTIQTPTRLTLSAAVGIGATATQALITARVLDQTGRGIANTPVSFATSKGSLAPINISTNSNGDAQTTLTSGVSSTVTVAGAGFTTSVDVAISAPLSVSFSLRTPEKNLPVDILALVTPTPTPPVRYAWSFGDDTSADTTTGSITHTWREDGPVTLTVSVVDSLERTGVGTSQIIVRDNLVPPAPPAPTQPTPPAGFTLALTCATQAALRVDCIAVGSFAGNPLPSSFLTNISWDWGDSTVQVNSVARSHVYPAAGTYPVFVAATCSTAPCGVDTVSTTTQAIAK